MSKYTLVERTPTVEEYHRLCKAVGWKSLDTEATKIGLDNSLFSVCIMHKGEVVVHMLILTPS